MGVLLYYMNYLSGSVPVYYLSTFKSIQVDLIVWIDYYFLHTAPDYSTGYRFDEGELCSCIWVAVPFPVSSRWLPCRHLVGRWEQPRDAGSLPSVSSWHAPYLHKLPHSRENGTDAVGLPVPSGDPGHVKPLWPGQTRQEAAGPAHDLWHSLWVLLQLYHNRLVFRSFINFMPPPSLCGFWQRGAIPGGKLYSMTAQFTKNLRLFMYQLLPLTDPIKPGKWIQKENISLL